MKLSEWTRGVMRQCQSLPEHGGDGLGAQGSLELFLPRVCRLATLLEEMPEAQRDALPLEVREILGVAA